MAAHAHHFSVRSTYCFPSHSAARRLPQPILNSWDLPAPFSQLPRDSGNQVLGWTFVIRNCPAETTKLSSTPPVSPIWPEIVWDRATSFRRSTSTPLRRRRSRRFKQDGSP